MKMPRPMTRLRSPSPSEAAPKSGAPATHHLVEESLRVHEVRVGMVPAEVGQRHPVAHSAGGGAEAALEDLGGIGAGDGVHGVEGHAEAAGKERADGVEVEEGLHQRRVVVHRIDHVDAHAAVGLEADLVEVEVGGDQDAVFVDHPRAREDRLGDALWRGTAIPDVVLDAEVLGRPAGIMAGRQDDATEGAAVADEVARGRGREEAALPDQHPAEAVGGGHLQGDLDDLAVEVAPVAADHQRLALEALEAVEDRLDEVLHVVGLLEMRHLLAQARSAGLLVQIGGGGDGLDVHALLPAAARSASNSAA